MPLEAGGGLRDLAAVEAALAAGAAWAVVGTRAALDPVFLKDVCRQFPGQIIVAVDGRGPRVAVKGWTEVVSETVGELAARARDGGAAALLYTDVSRDGTGRGRLAGLPGVVGAVVGQALYTGAVDLAVALGAVER